MPTENDDIITFSNDEVWGLGGNDLFIWQGGNSTVHGGSDSFDSNPYQPYELEEGIRTGDMLKIDSTQGAKIFFTGWNSGYAKIGNATVHYDGVERIYGSAGNDTIRAGGFTSSIDQYQGVSIFSGAGNDDIVGSRFDDVIDGGTGNDTIRAGNGNDFINSSVGNDLIYGGAGDENIRWGVGDAHWHNPGNDTIYGGEGYDLINVWVTEGATWANNGSATGGHVVINNIRANGEGFNGTATVGTDNAGGYSTLKFQGFEQGWTHEGDDTIDGSNAKVNGSEGFRWGARWGDDILIGSKGNDTLEGGEGSDTITGGTGDDVISANGEYYNWNASPDQEVDTIIFRAGHGHDTIMAFGDNDILDLGGRDYIVTEVENGTLLTNGQDSILLANVFDWG